MFLIYSHKVLMDFQVGFHLKSRGDNSFSCQKLGQIVVKINPGEGAEEILPSALLSLSGDDGYRKNAATISGDAFAFTDLFPGSFYLRPLLKVLFLILTDNFFNLSQIVGTPLVVCFTEDLNESGTLNLVVVRSKPS